MELLFLVPIEPCFSREGVREEFSFAVHNKRGAVQPCAGPVISQEVAHGWAFGSFFRFRYGNEIMLQRFEKKLAREKHRVRRVSGLPRGSMPT